MNTIFLDRTYSSFPLSIGTGLALESLFKNTIDRYDNTRVIPNNIKVDDYKYHFYSIYTLIRNIIAATNVKNKNEVLFDKDLIHVLVEELNIIQSLYLNTKCEPILYFPSYDKVLKYLNADKESTINKSYDEAVVIANVMKEIKKLSPIPVVTDFKIQMTNDKALITTSYAVDLLNVKNVKSLSLLESHTGKLKEKIDWNTKYHAIGSKPNEVFPFTEPLLYILGDKTLVKPMKISLRMQLFNLAYENNWTGKTTQDKINYDINKSPELKELISNYKKFF